MRKIKTNARHFLFKKVGCFMVAIFVFLTGCHKAIETQPVKAGDLNLEELSKKKIKTKKDFVQTNLVANNGEYHPLRIDPLLVNAWGLAWSSNGIAWIGAQAGHVSTVYNGEGGEIRPAVNIPSPGGPTGGNPTGVVFNASLTDFKLPLPNDQPARFLFVGVDGVLSGWNSSAGNNALLIKNNVANSAYTGLALATSGGANYLYAANFRARRIDVWDKDFKLVSMPFTDRHLPAGYSPFNIQNIDGLLYVMYAKVGPDGRDQAGKGNGFVDIYRPNGWLVKRFASHGSLNSPWGVAKAPASFFRDAEDSEGEDDGNDYGDHDRKGFILVGNFGNGHINVFRGDGKFVGELATHHSPIKIEGLWAISFAPATATTLDPNRLYFTAGPDEEADGLFGYIKRK